MDRQSSPISLRQIIEDRSRETKRAVSDILDQIPELVQVRQVRRRDGSLEDFEPQKIGESLEVALKAVGVKDEALLAKMTHQALTRLERDFDGREPPSGADLDNLIALTLIDNNLAYAAKKHLTAATGFAPARVRRAPSGGLRFRRRFSRPDVHPYDEIEWERRDAVIADDKGRRVFEQLGVEVPKFWSQSATNIVASKYFRGAVGQDRESSVRQIIDRVVQTIVGWGVHGGYFAAESDAATYEAELTALLLGQRAAFNSPVWFNVGVVDRPQCSACFINSVQDDMRSILNLAVTEGMLFKFGSGTGSNLSTLRSSKERLNCSSGKSSGPVSFMRGFDAFAGVIKSGGKTRRAAKMVILNADHPDINDFITCKASEERKARHLVAAGYDGSMDGEAYSSVFFQNANNSVRVTDDFMRAVIDDGEWQTRAVTTGEPVETMRARDLMRKIASAAWECGDPGLQYDTAANRWNTVPNSGRINGSNPCVTGDTLVATEGGWCRIDALLKSPTAVIGADGRSHDVKPAFVTGIKPVYLLRTQAGFEIKLTADHRILTANRGDVAASELTRDDVLPLGQPAFGRSKLDDRLGEFLGLAVGDGCLTKGQETVIVTLSPEERAVATRVSERLEDYRREHAADGRAARRGRVNRPQSTLRFGTSARCAVEPLKKLAILDRGSAGKSFQSAVFSLDRDSLAAILRGLFTADGTVANYGVKSQYVSLDSISLDLLKQVQLLLLQFGIKSKLYRDRRVVGQATALLPDGRGGQKEYPVVQSHSLRISRDSRLTFEKAIGFIAGSSKVERLAVLNREVSAYADRLEDRPVSLEYLGEETVYDLTEPATAHFVAGGLIVHNCSEFMFIDDSSCNLASLNLLKFRRPDGEFDVEGFKHAVEVITTAQEIVVDNAGYPTPAIEANSLDFRPLGLGYANLGALLMARGLAYDSDAGRNFAGAVTALMSGHAYFQSAKLAQALGPFYFYKLNEKPMLRVIGAHRDCAYEIPEAGVPTDLLESARQSWDNAFETGLTHGFRNAQVSCLAPTGTIGFLMDCDTTGVEPDIALVKYKWLVGGGLLKIVNQTVPEALVRLGYSEADRAAILGYLDENGTIEGAPGLKPEHLPVFDCAFRPAKGSRSIQYLGHIRMMAAVQPFISGAISKTVNLPNEATPEDIEKTFIESWKLGLKAIAIYRDGSKGLQVLTTSIKKNDGETERRVDKDKETERRGDGERGGEVEPAARADESPAAAAEPMAPKPAMTDVQPTAVPRAAEGRPQRRRLSDERKSITHKFSIAGHEGYITVGLYDDGTPGELFLRMSKGGTIVSGLMDSLAMSVSIALQYGVPLKVLVNKFIHIRFEPSGFTSNPNIRIAKSLVDYLFRWLALKFLSPEDQRAAGLNLEIQTLAETGKSEVELSRNPQVMVAQETAEARAEAERRQLKLTDAAPTAAREQTSDALTIGFDAQADAPVCDTCGALMIRSGACYKCLNCGSTSGCS